MAPHNHGETRTTRRYAAAVLVVALLMGACRGAGDETPEPEPWVVTGKSLTFSETLFGTIEFSTPYGAFGRWERPVVLSGEMDAIADEWRDCWNANIVGYPLLDCARLDEAPFEPDSDEFLPR